MSDSSRHLLEDIQNYHILYGLVKVCTENKAVMEKRNDFFKECCNTAARHGTIAGDAEAWVVTSTTQLNVNPVFGGAIYQETVGLFPQYQTSVVSSFR